MKPILLDEQKIKNQLSIKKFSRPYQLHLFTTINSTNRFLKEIAPSPLLDVCCAEQQTQGRGRFGRHWYSPFGENIYFSSRWTFSCAPNKLSGLSLISSLAVLATLNELKLSPNIKVKWPNDILWGDKKLCGSLIEIITKSNGDYQVIIGIGLNVNTDTNNQVLSDKSVSNSDSADQTKPSSASIKPLSNGALLAGMEDPISFSETEVKPEKLWCSLYDIANKQFDRNTLIASLLVNIDIYLNKFIINGLEAFTNEWNEHDYLIGKYISVTQADALVYGTVAGINKMGQLILVDKQDTVHFLSSGDTSLSR